MARPRPVCVKCQKEMAPTKNNCIVQVNKGTGEPYQLWPGDQYTCMTCDATIVAGFGQRPMAEAHERTFQGYMDSLPPDRIRAVIQ